MLVLNAARNSEEIVRCGFITGKKVGKAVQRNRARRLIREAIRRRLPDIKPGWDLVWIGRASIVGATYEAVCKAVDDLLQRAKVLTVSQQVSQSSAIAQVTPPGLDNSERNETAGAQSRIIDVAAGYPDHKSAAPTGGVVRK